MQHGLKMKKIEINICQPGFGASCALCCGSHEGSGCYEELENLYQHRALNIKAWIGEEKSLPETVPAPPAENTPCPWIGHINSDSKSTSIGCLIYNNPAVGGESWLKFINKTCRCFSCQARDTLTEQEIEYAARLCRDWFFYSLIIHLPEKLREVMRLYPVPEQVSSEKNGILKEYLRSQM